jgi:pentatricopeptide repeat protein
MMKNIHPNEITFGIMIKIFGFAKELTKAFDLLDLMETYGINPSIVIFTNLIHISFYNKNPKKAELAFNLYKKKGLPGDRLMYSKLVNGLIKF